MASGKKMLVVLTSNDKLGETGEQTGWYLPELAHPFNAFKTAGIEMTLASPLGGEAPVDLSSIEASKEDAECVAFWADEACRKLVKETVPLADIKAEDFDAVFVVGGFGVMWDLVECEPLQAIIAKVYESPKGIVSAVCHGPAALTQVKLSDGSFLVKDKQVAGFTAEEEDAVSRRAIVPFIIEQKMMENGAVFTKRGVFQAHTVTDGKLITGQNPPSAGPTALAVIAALTAA